MADTVNTTQALSFSDLCRLCAVETVENGVNIFDEINSSEPLVAIINRYFPIKIVGDGKLPKKICQSCNQSVKDIISYFNLLVSGQQRLRELWKEQLERLRREKKQLESNGSDFTILITAPAANPDGQQLFDENHVISLAIEGRESPRRRPGRPRKQKPTEISVELMLEDTTAQQPAEDVDPEQALELMFKEAEENRITSFDSSRHRRQRRVPQRFQGVVQGKELDAILRDEGLEEELIEENEELDKDDETAVEVILEEDENERPTRSKLSKKLHKKRQFVCHHCCRTFVHFGHFTQHVRNCPHQSKFACLTCKEMYDTKEELSVHQEQSRHNEEEMVSVQSAEPEEEIGQQEEYKCVCCEAIYNQQSALTKHITEVHAAENSNICDLCGKIFSHPSSVIYHKEVAHSKRAFNCQICQKEFKHRQLLQRHLLVHSDDRPFVCHVCGATFKTRANLYNHSNIHSEEKRYSCTHCDAQFSHKTSLTLHTRWHTGEKPFACNFCDKKFSQGGNLQEHLRIHTGEKPYSCNVCSKRFTTSSQRRLHMKRHTGERPYKCEFCGKDFLHKDSYECHLRRHRGDKPFSCEICQRTFAEQWALKKHSRLHTGEKPYSCTICNKAFSDLSNLQKHKKTHKNGEQAELADGTGLNAAANVADNQEDSTNALSTLTDGQHFIYVTNDQSQLLITTIGNQTGLPVFGTDEAIECDPSLISLQTEPHHGVETSETPTLNNNHQEEEAIEHSGGNQTVEFITQDGNRIRLTLPVKR